MLSVVLILNLNPTILFSSWDALEKFDTVAEYGLSSDPAAINRGVWSRCDVISGLVAMENNNAVKQWMCLFPHNKERQAEKTSLICSFATGYKTLQRLEMFVFLNQTTPEACLNEPSYWAESHLTDFKDCSVVRMLIKQA